MTREVRTPHGELGSAATFPIRAYGLKATTCMWTCPTSIASSRCTHTAPRTNRPRLCDARSIRVSLLEPRAWDEVCKLIENQEMVLNELRARQGRTTALDEEIERIQATIKTLDAQKQRAMRLFTIAEASDADVKRELARINKLHLPAHSRLAELESRRAVSAQFEPMAAKVTLYCELMRDRLNDLSFEQKREVLDALQAQFTLDKEGEGELRIVLVLPSVSETSESYTTLRHASA